MTWEVILLLISGITVGGALFKIVSRRKLAHQKFSLGAEQATAIRDVLVAPKEAVAEPALGDPTLAALGFGDEIIIHAKNDTFNERVKITPAMKRVSRRKVPELVILHLSAGEGRHFYGYELLQALLAAGLRHGKMGIFHRYENDDEKEAVLFSVASSKEPGIIDINRIGSFSCPGLSFFMKTKNLSFALTQFESMLEIAKQLAEELGGELLDDRRQLLTIEKLEAYRERLSL